jgi:hypothetical protein
VEELVPRETLDPATSLPAGRFIAERTGRLVLVESSSSADLTSYRVAARIQRKLARNLWGALQLSYTDQKVDDNNFAVSRDFSNASAVISLSYRFDPVRF